ncbi:MAG: type III polyketide synthase [Chitinophagaceae bacterium]|nr:MAG: type III polyketide synthase [Chitinophagaceae bacterium]
MSKIISIGTANPAYRHHQSQILEFMQMVYAFGETDRRKLKFLYHHSGIDSRYSVVPDYSLSLDQWQFFSKGENLEPAPSVEQRMKWFNKYAPGISVDAIRAAIGEKIQPAEITHLITVSCTGMSAPGLDLLIMEEMDLPRTIYRTSVNVMGCYAAIHALKIANDICRLNAGAKVIIVCTELCTLHFQRDAGIDNVASALLFGDGSAAVLITGDDEPSRGLRLSHFYSEILTSGKKDMTWEISSTGFLMTLSGYIPELIEQDFEPLVSRALTGTGLSTEDIDHWCVHPGGKKILEAVGNSLSLEKDKLRHSYDTMREYGNMSSPTILFVLKRILEQLQVQQDAPESQSVFCAAFGPGLTMETLVASY